MKNVITTLLIIVIVHFFQNNTTAQANSKIASPTGTNGVCLPCGGGDEGGGGGGGTPCATALNTVYVDKSRPDNSGSGYTWATAKKELMPAINIANNCSNITKIYVAEGTYQPIYANTPSNYKDYTFFIGNNFSLYGGFAPGGESRNSVAHPTILFGRAGPDGSTEFVHHVMVAYNIAEPIIIDGFQIKNGNANGTGSINIDVATPMNRYEGGGVYLKEVDNITFKNCVFASNQATVNGGTIYASNSNATFYNTIIYNSRAEFGPAIYLTGSEAHSSKMYHSTINDVGLSNSMIYKNGNNVMNVWNSILWENINPSIWSGAGTFNIYNSILNMDYNLNGCINTSPMFENINDPDGPDNKWFTSDDGLQVCDGSPAINRGRLITSPVYTVDISNHPREYGLPDIGPFELQREPIPDLLAINGTQADVKVIDNLKETAISAPGSCRIIANILPNGDNPVAGQISAKAYVPITDLSYGSYQFVNRHYDIRPNILPSVATARLSLFFYDTDFIELNNRFGVIDKLPVFSFLGIDKSKLRIIKYGGTSASGLPGTYSGTTQIIDPDDNDIIFYPNGIWKISFNVSGFSGFFVTAVAATPLPISIVKFEGSRQNNSTILNWQTSSETNFSHFEIEKSLNEKGFQKIGEIIGTKDEYYQFIDKTESAQVQYYRLKLLDIDGKFSYSKIISINSDNDLSQPIVFPNPASNQLNLQIPSNFEIKTIKIFDLTGRIILENSKTEIDVSKLNLGKYFIQIVAKSGNIFNKSFIKTN